MDRRPRDRAIEHSGQLDIDPELGGAIDLASAFIAPGGLTQNLEFAGIFECYRLGRLNIESMNRFQ